MAIYAHECPHCRTRIANRVYGAALTANMLPALLLNCGVCHKPTVVIVNSNVNPQEIINGWNNDKLVINDVAPHIYMQFPPPVADKAPDHVPSEVARVFVQARAAHLRTEMDIAAMGYRRAVELALKAADPSIKGQLGPRTDALAARSVLTGAMKDWAIEVRLLGNEANHDPPEPDEAALEDLHLFTESLLEHLFTMPKRIAERRAFSAAAKAAHGSGST